MINPAKMLKMKEYWNQFAANHPRCVSFLGAVSSEPMEVGTIIEVSITKPDGSVKCWMMYGSLQEYLNAVKKYNYEFAVTKYVHKNIEKRRR